MIEDWLEIETQECDDRKTLYIVVERPGVRIDIRDQLVERVRSHYDDLRNIEADIADLGFSGAAKILRKRMPIESRQRSGEIGEILATEFMEHETEFRIPVRRLRYKDGRDMALRGDDFIGIKRTDARLDYLKGEAKSSQNMARNVICIARAQLGAEDGRPTDISLLFVTDRLLEGGEDDRILGRSIRNSVGLGTIQSSNITHGLFTLTGNDNQANLQADLDNAPNEHNHVSVNLQILDHQEFIAWVYREAENLGDG